MNNRGEYLLTDANIYGGYEYEEETKVGFKTTRLITKTGKFNIKRHVSIWRQFKADVFNTILNLRWYILILLSLAQYTFVNLLFTLLYIVDLDGIGGSTKGYYWDAFFFSFQTISTIGFGHLYPSSFYISIINYFQAWSGLLILGVTSALAYAKISRPSRLRRTLLFSDVGTINNSTPYCVQSPDGNLSYETGDYCLSFRILNLRRRQLINPILRLQLLRDVSTENAEKTWYLQEMDFEINKQMPRAYKLGFSVPILSLPMTVVHRIGIDSPLYPFMQPDGTLSGDVEIIVVIEGTDELTANMFQSRMSYLPEEIIYNHRFKPILTRNSETGVFEICHEALSQTDAC